MKASILRSVNYLLMSIAQAAGVPELHVDFSKKSCLMLLTGLFVNSDVRGLLEVRNCSAKDMLFWIIRAYIDRGTEFQKGAKMTIFNYIYSNTVSKVV